ncbi:beta-galactosidase [Halosimplex rubrum]|uniref:Beta-galactosidase n=1 Tax=Halosimplex rubrum TaxID=869889 RepID=A0A7D5T7K8_9EURY|nr:sugar-binding domain-containing protein [Halosimplex rubrum]QLH78435.1 beta-galactosidase [Halosimplex rubrum]
MQTPESAISLDGVWQFSTGPSARVDEVDWYEPHVEWPDSRTVSVPHSWQEEVDLREYTGTAWYRRSFEFDGFDGDELAFLSFDAVDYEATVWVNGEHVGDHRGGYLPFDLDVTDAVMEGENEVVLRVSDPEDLSEIPHGKQGDPWYTRVSGPWQSVSLVTVPETHVTDVRVTPDLSTDTVTVDMTVANGAGEDVVVTVSRLETDVAEEVATLTDGEASVDVSIPDADYWTPEDPALYDVEVKLRGDGETVDTYSDYFGMRSFTREDGDFYLNGEQFTMRGALDQAFYPETYYRPRDLETFEQEIRTAKELGFNLLRKHIKPAHPAFLELADRLGILVWEEPANPSVYSDRSKAELREQFEGMVARDYNRPSVVIWSLYNEEWGIGGHEDEEPLWTDEAKQDYLEAFYEDVRDLDETRLVCDNSGWAHVATDINDYHEYFIAPDRVDAWREKLNHIIEAPEENYGDVRTEPSVPLVVSEFGTWGLSDLSRLTDSYGGDPHWFDHDFLNGLKRPGGVRERFKASHASDVFDSLDDLATAWQRREFESIETIIGDMRENDSVAGYVITELTDIEWEFNGILDYRREEKSFHDDFERVNAPVMLHLDPDASAAWDDETYCADIVVANETGDPVDTTIEWHVFEESGKVEVAVGPHEAARFEEAVSVPVPDVDDLCSESVEVSMSEPNQSVERSVWVVPRTGAPGSQTVFAADDGLAAALDDRGYETVDDPSTADVALVSDPDAYDHSNLLVVPDADGDVVETEAVEYTELPKEESWNLCACFVYQDLLPEVDVLPGWAFENIYPYAYVSDPRDDDAVSVGYLEGWIGNSGAIALSRPGGDVAGVCTLRVTDVYGDHPIATVALDRVVKMTAPSEADDMTTSARQD